MCTLHDFPSSKVRFIDTSTVTGSHSSSGKATCTPRVHLGCYYIHVAPIQREVFSYSCIIVTLLMCRGGSRMVGALRLTMWWGPLRRSA